MFPGACLVMPWEYLLTICPRPGMRLAYLELGHMDAGGAYGSRL